MNYVIERFSRGNASDLFYFYLCMRSLPGDLDVVLIEANNPHAHHFCFSNRIMTNKERRSIL